MKSVEKILGLAAILIMSVGFFIKIDFISIAIALVLLLLSLIYFGLSFALFNNVRLRHIFKSGSFKGINTLRIIGSVLVGFVFSIMCIGILFKFQLWPNGNYTLLVSLVCLGFLVITSLVKFLTSKDKFYKNLLFRTVTIGIIGLFFYSMSYETILELRYRDYPEYVEAEKQLWQDPENLELRQKASEERQKMHQD